MPHEWTEHDDREFHRFAFLHIAGWVDDLPRYRRRDTLDDATTSTSSDDDQEADPSRLIRKPTRAHWWFLGCAVGLLLVLAVL